MQQINTINYLTDKCILNISDDLFIQTQAYKTFNNKEQFVNKIHDKNIRYKMMKNILLLNIYF